MSVDTSGGHKDMDYKEHIRTFEGFWLGTKVLIGVVIAILVGMALTLVH
jgi:Bacterial aa3 type cytochrome c oxidase subunit IV